MSLEAPSPSEQEVTGCFPRNYVLPSAIPRIRSDELVEEAFLGDGGFGRVYKHMYKGRNVAVKETGRSQDTECGIRNVLTVLL